MPRAFSSTTPSAVRRKGRSWPALAYSIAPLVGSSEQREAGDEHRVRHVVAQQVVDVGQDRTGRGQFGRGRSKQRMRAGHDQRCRDALVGDVADDDHDAAVAQRDEVVEVAAHLPCRPVERGHGPARQIGQLLGQELLLDELRDLEFLLDALALAGFGLLLEHQLADPDRGRCVTGEGVEQVPVVGRVVALGKPGPEMQQADQFARRDEGDDEHDTGRPHRREAGGVEHQVGDVDRAVGALAVAQDRVVLRDVERRPDMHRRGRFGNGVAPLRRRSLRQPRAAGVLLGERVGRTSDGDFGSHARGIGCRVARRIGRGPG